MVANSITSYAVTPDLLTKIILYWMIFCILIGILEFVLFFMSKKISLMSNNIKSNYWLREIEWQKLFKPTFWSYAWKEYGDFCDQRYRNHKNLVHWIEITHAITSFLYLYIIYQFIRNKNIQTSQVIGGLLIAIASIHLIGTVIYFSTFYKFLNKNPIKKSTKFWIYLALNLLWVVMPVVILVKGSKLIHAGLKTK